MSTPSTPTSAHSSERSFLSASPNGAQQEGRLDLSEGEGRPAQVIEADQERSSVINSVYYYACGVGGVVRNLEGLFLPHPPREIVNLTGQEEGNERPLHNTMCFMFGLIRIKDFDTIEKFLSSSDITDDIRQHWEERNEEGHTLVEALDHLKVEYFEKLKELIAKREYRIEHLKEAVCEEATEEARKEFQATLKEKIQRATNFTMRDREMFEPLIEKIESFIEILNALR